jgi:hypothetical protein
MAWNSHCTELINWSRKYFESEEINPHNILQEWSSLIDSCQSIWEKLVTGESIFTEFENQEELREEGLLEQEELQFLDAQQDDLIDLTMNNND